MKKIKILSVTIFLTAITIIAGGKNLVLAQDFISVTPGNSATREFYINDVFNYSDFSYGHYFVVSTLGIEESAGDLTTTLSASPTKEFTGRLVYTLAGVGTSIDGGVVSVFENGQVPGQEITATVAVDSVFGIYVMAVMVNRIIGEVEMPVPMTIKFSVSKME